MNRITFLRTSSITACALLVSALVWLSFEYGTDAHESPHTDVGDLTTSIENVVASEARNLTRHARFLTSDDQSQESLVTASLVPRQINLLPKSEGYKRALAKGREIQDYFNGSKTVDAAPKIDKSALLRSGWTAEKMGIESRTHYRILKKVENALASINIDLSPDENYGVLWKHDKAADAKFSNIYNPSHGFIFAHGGPAFPKHGAKRPKADRPSLEHWSNFAFYDYSNLATTPAQMKNLRYILRFQIQNDGTKDSTIECLKQWFQWPKGEGIKAWPGWLIDDKQHAMMPWRKGVHTAMLSTPNVQGVAFLLLQHKEAFGDKVIGDIRIWNPDSTGGSIKTNDMCLLVEIKDKGT